MSFASDDMVRTVEPGFLASADGNYSAGVAPASLPAGFAAAAANASSPRDAGDTGAAESPVLGPNNERLEDVKPELVQSARMTNPAGFANVRATPKPTSALSRRLRFPEGLPEVEVETFVRQLTYNIVVVVG